jgi:hypothetical protein
MRTALLAEPAATARLMNGLRSSVNGDHENGVIGRACRDRATEPTRMARQQRQEPAYSGDPGATSRSRSRPGARLEPAWGPTTRNARQSLPSHGHR